MAKSPSRSHFSRSIDRREFLGYTAGAGLLAAGLSAASRAQAQTTQLGVDAASWTPDYISSIAGTVEFDTAAECAKVVPLNYSGRLTYWYVGPNQASPQIEHEIDAKGQLKQISPEDVGFQTSEFWPGAMKSVPWGGKTYGIPTNNETMALIWNADLFKQAGLEPEAPPATWDDLVVYSKQIKQKTGKNGYGMVARVNAGNTPFRFMPQCWAFGGGALDEAEAKPTYKQVYINNAGSKAALQASYDMYVRDKSVPTSALTNTQTENQDPFISGQLAMMIAHPSEYATMVDRAKKATGDDKKTAEAVVANMRYGLIPKGQARRAVVFGGSNAHVFNPNVVDGKLDFDAARAFIAFTTGPEWSTKLAWTSSNPGNVRGFRSKWMKQRLDTIKFLNVTTSMLPNGVPFPVVPESAEIMNIIVPNMLQNALTQKMTTPGGRG